MDVLFRQLRTKYPHVGEQSKERSSTLRDRIQPPQKTESFKGEKRRTQSWIRRQFSKQMNQDYDPTAEGDYQTALAAAAFAVKSLEESRTRDQKMQHPEPDVSSTKIKTKPDDTTRAPEPRTRSIKFSDEIPNPNLTAAQDETVKASAEASKKPPEKALGLVPSIKKKLSFADTTPTSQPERALPAEEPIGMIPSLKKPLALDRRSGKKQDTPEPRLEVPPPKEPPFLPANARTQISEITGIGDSEADEWERVEMSRIKEKYEKLNATILEWENKKKRKAKRQLDKTQAELDKRRAKVMQHYRSELARIGGIAGGARSQAIENRRNEELKVREKAYKIRLTGKLPVTCLCC